ncbi:MAG: 4Fe-4S double cluster binding domain-containing protein [Oscillospiraceae bacterium]
MQDIKEQIRQRLLSLGVSDVGFSSVEDGLSGLKNAVSVVVHLSDAIVEEIDDKPTHTYFNHYRTVNAFIDFCLLQTGLLLEQNGYRYITVAASQSINDEGWSYRGRYSHKKAAVLAGLGTVGKSCLFLHKKYGARVRLGTVFTDCEFSLLPVQAVDFCTGCNICKEHCPSGAILGKSWDSEMPREDFFKANLCSEYMKKEFKAIGRGAVCGLCVRYCPYNGQKKQGDEGEYE